MMNKTRPTLITSLSDRRISASLIIGSLSLVSWLLFNQVRVTQEDGFYYFKIAQHAARGDGSTFDGVNPTNGYHPLWLWCLTLVFRLVADPHGALIAGTVLQAMLMSATSVLIYRTARLRLSRAAASFAALGWIMLTYRVSIGGLEFSAQALGLAVTAYIYSRWFASDNPRNTGPYIALGVSACATFLARVDTIVLAAVLGLALINRARRETDRRTAFTHVALFALPSVIAVVLYILGNFVWFGQPWSVSSQVKADWSRYWLAQDPIYESRGWLAAKLNQSMWAFRNGPSLFRLYVTIGFWGVAVWWMVQGLMIRRFVQVRHFHDVMKWTLPLAIYSWLNYLSYVVLYHGGLTSPTWYYVIQPWLIVMIAAALFDQTWRRVMHTPSAHLRPQRVTMIGLSIVWLAVPLNTARSAAEWLAQDRSDPRATVLYAAAYWAHDHLPADAVIGSWNAGTIGYLSDRRVINLDGLVNSWEYYYFDRTDLCAYWSKMGITYLVDVFEDGRAVSAVPTYPNYAACADRLDLLWQDDRYDPSWVVAVYRIRGQGR